MVSLSVSNLSKSFRVKDKNIQVLSDISINFPDNGIVGLLGKNGAGKTTFIKSCVNLISYDGIIKYYGEDLQILYKKGIHTNYFTALFEGNRNIYWKLTPIENIKYFAGLRGVKYNLIEKKSLEIMELLDIADKSNRLVETLSRGMQQKTALAIALSFDTPIIFLDEPTLGLDLESRNNLINFFQKQNAVKEKLFIISSHDLEFITSICKDIYILREGVINKYDDIPRKSVFRVLSKFPLNSLDLYRNLNIVNDFCYDIPCDLLQLLSLTSEEQGFIKSISNLKYDLESLLLK